MHPITGWFILNLLLMPFEEHYNTNHPKPFPSRKVHILMNWEEKDFIYWKISKTYELKRYRKSDNIFKAKARRKWHEQKANKTR